MKKVTTLLTSAGVATAVNVIHALRKSENLDVNIVAVDMDPLSAGLFLADVQYQVPGVRDSNYLNELLRICMDEKVDFMFPLYSGEISIISRQSEAFIKNGISLMVPMPEVVDLCINKRFFIQFLKVNNFPFPRTYTKNDIENFNEDSFPLFIKPVSGSSSKNAFKINHFIDLKYYLNKFPESIIQEFILGQEYTVDCLVFNRKVYACVPRQRIKVKDGKSVVGKTVYHKKIIEIVEDLLMKIGIDGPCNVQLIENKEGELFVIEVNPRLAAGGLPLSVEAGANIPEMMLQLSLGIALAPVKSYKSDLYMIRYLNDIFIQEEHNGYRRI